jgi:hypothetical protein
MKYIGLDIHKSSSQVTVMDKDGGIVEKRKNIAIGKQGEEIARRFPREGKDFK